MSRANELTRTEAMERARTMYGDGTNGWSIAAIRSYLAARGVHAGWNTVKCWVDPATGEAQRVAQRSRMRIKERERTGTRVPRVMDEDGLLRRIRALSGAHVPASSIAKVIRLDHGLDIQEHAVRMILTQGRLPPQLAKRVAA